MAAWPSRPNPATKAAHYHGPGAHIAHGHRAVGTRGGAANSNGGRAMVVCGRRLEHEGRGGGVVHRATPRQWELTEVVGHR
jgi:hypothetical protein